LGKFVWGGMICSGWRRLVAVGKVCVLSEDLPEVGSLHRVVAGVFRAGGNSQGLGD